jgi:hypothetical protein
MFQYHDTRQVVAKHRLLHSINVCKENFYANFFSFTVETPRCGKWRNLPSYDVIWHHMTQWPSYDVIWRNIFFFEFFFKIFYFYDQISLFVLFNTFLWVENAFFIFDFYFRSLKFELKGNSTSVWSKKSLFFESIQK